MRYAVLMAAGASTRCYPLTLTRPKVLLKIANKTIIEHNLDQLNGIVDTVILIIGYEKEMIKEHLGNKYKKLKIKYVEQKQQKGTAHAALQAEPYVKGRFILMNGDDLFFKKDILKCIKHKYSILAAPTTTPERFGIISEKQGYFDKIIEKPKSTTNNLASPGVYVVDTSIFKIIKNLKKSKRGEFEITDAMNQFAKANKVKVVKTNKWLPTGYSWDLLNSNQFLLENLKTKIKGKVEKGVTIKGKVEIGKGTIVKSGTYIEGPVMIGENCVIGPNAYIRPDTTIGNNCNICSEVIDCIIMDHVISKHYSYLGHSIIGEGCNIGAGTITADFRHDGKDNITVVNGKKVDSKRRKLGAFLGDKVNTGINTSIYPGRKIWPGKTTLPGEVVTKDIL